MASPPYNLDGKQVGYLTNSIIFLNYLFYTSILKICNTVILDVIRKQGKYYHESVELKRYMVAINGIFD